MEKNHTKGVLAPLDGSAKRGEGEQNWSKEEDEGMNEINSKMKLISPIHVAGHIKSMSNSHGMPRVTTLGNSHEVASHLSNHDDVEYQHWPTQCQLTNEVA